MSLNKQSKYKHFLCKLLHENTISYMLLLHGSATNNPIHLWLLFPSLNNFGIWHSFRLSVEVWCKASLINFDFFSCCDLKLKLCQITLQKMGLILKRWEVKVFEKGKEKNSTCYNRGFFLFIFTKKNYI